MKKTKDDAITGIANLYITRLEKENKILIDEVFKLRQQLIDKTAESFKEALVSSSHHNLSGLTKELEKHDVKKI